MACCKDEGGDPLFCERRAMGKWTCLEAENCLTDLEVLWSTGELHKEEKEN